MLRTVACRGCSLLRAGAWAVAERGSGQPRSISKGDEALACVRLGRRQFASVVAPAPSNQAERVDGEAAREGSTSSSSSSSSSGSPAEGAVRAKGGAAQGGASARLLNRRARIAPIKLTERAAERIKELLQGRENIAGVRLGVKRRGCNGLSYTMNYSEEKPKFDEEVNEKGVRVFIDPMALMHIVGTVMDFEETELSSEFTFNNPNAKGKCGCGESFSV